MPEHFGSLKDENSKEILMKRNTYTCRMSEKNQQKFILQNKGAYHDMVPMCFINMYTPKGHLDIQLAKTTENPPGSKNLERLWRYMKEPPLHSHVVKELDM